MDRRKSKDDRDKSRRKSSVDKAKCVRRITMSVVALWLLSRTRDRVWVLVPLKTHRVEGLKHVKSVEAQSPPIDVVW
ncbi:hypothetical protein TNCV_997171 [Trichonephila clavipes]|uniref:Uncharacterized protein n=1 Tax=Trichonephila clavipes TaxID=2585209 RepID=A0A8X7BJF9_TRICX|nr:hypothetical protein TNCV_997171 [Trichonephila clavipes]